jgi:hypothetical protein
MRGFEIDAKEDYPSRCTGFALSCHNCACSDSSYHIRLKRDDFFSGDALPGGEGILKSGEGSPGPARRAAALLDLPCCARFNRIGYHKKSAARAWVRPLHNIYP